jgi:hypothetical protein
MRSSSTRSLLALCAAFTLCACAGVGADAAPKLTVSVNNVHLTGCPTPATPLPGWRNCTGTILLSVTGTPSSGYISTYMDYGSTGTFYHGQVAVVSGTSSYTVNVVSEYVPQCYTSLATSVDVYDGSEANSNAPLIASIPITLSGSC